MLYAANQGAPDRCSARGSRVADQGAHLVGAGLTSSTAQAFRIVTQALVAFRLSSVCNNGLFIGGTGERSGGTAQLLLFSRSQCHSYLSTSFDLPMCTGGTGGSSDQVAIVSFVLVGKTCLSWSSMVF